MIDDLWGFDWPLSRAFNNLSGVGSRYPRVNIWDGDQGWVVEAELPGVDPAKLDVSVEGRTLTLKGNRERADGGELAFERHFELPQEIATDDIKAKFANGILTLELPRHPAAVARKIAIETAK